MAGAVGLLLAGPAAADGRRGLPLGRRHPHRHRRRRRASCCSPGRRRRSSPRRTPSSTCTIAAARKIARALGVRFALPAALPLDRSHRARRRRSGGSTARASGCRAPVIDRAAAALGSLLGTLGITDDPPQRPEVRVVIKQRRHRRDLGRRASRRWPHPGDIVDARAADRLRRAAGRARAAHRARAGRRAWCCRCRRRSRPAPAASPSASCRARCRKLRAPRRDSDVFDIGWCEHVALPELGVTPARQDRHRRAQLRAARHLDARDRLRRRRQRARRHHAARRARPRARAARASSSSTRRSRTRAATPSGAR